MNLFSFLIRWKIISRNHKILGKWYFRSIFLASSFFLLAIGFAIVADKPNENQQYFLNGFYLCLVLGLVFVSLIILIEVYAFLAWLKRLVT